MRRALGMLLFWIFGTLAISFAFLAFRGLISDMGLHVIDSTDFSAFLASALGIPCVYIWLFMIRTG